MQKINFINPEAITNNFLGQDQQRFSDWLNSTERAGHVISDTLPDAERWISDADVSNFKSAENGH